MNKDEKKALVNFLAIYIVSTILLLGVILYIYYKNETKMLEESCSMQLHSTSMQIKNDIINKYMKNQKFNPAKLEDINMKYALFDKNKKVIFSYLDEKFTIDFSKSSYENEFYNYFITTLNEDNIPIKYIVLETCQEVQSKNKLQIFILVILFLSAIFIGFIGYLLSKILLKPVRQRIESMDKFIKDSAHELNTPISVLMTSVSMLKNGKNPQKMMKYILSSSKQISQIYNDIHFSAFNELNEDVFEKFNLKDLISESVEFFNDISITKNIVINSELEDCFIKMDRTKTQKIVNNLLSNAIKYSKKDSIIEVVLKENILKVTDFGIGISIDEQKEIFKRYKRGNNIEGGFGIGLDIVKRVCNEYNLDLTLKSQIDKGTTFCINFSTILNKDFIC
ncbi:sensor histidine kinase [Arcobacter aquimarinus]|uniref:histidine kinase n=1 Tax=Arcobacter aquimarinus TaxID=1315211 RepID=A0AAE7B1I8_9BACT|nr:HAMP domain-containing sensor histidine kinase [Arcobacter aquimarinus]QKE25634.1 two-component system sensor histidine kinase [Arcobacter aquimarinus]RXI35025.1 two-component sensor histidine kinase [Arcobacter aquimarinus]